MITEVLNSFLNVRNKVKNSNGEWEDKTVRTETIEMKDAFNVAIPSNNGELNIFTNWGKKIILDELTYNTVTRQGNSSFYPRLNVLRNYPTSSWVGQLFHVVQFGDGFNRTQAQAPSIEKGFSENLEVMTFNDEFQNDPEDPRYYRIISLKKPIVLPQGASLTFVNPTNETVYTTYKAVYRVIEGEQ